jgi:FixJ family two-component response regulator
MSEGRHLVLVVDDDEAVRESLKFALELEGLRVLSLGSGPDLLAHPSLSQADCVILDCQMPEMTGFEVLDRLRNGNITVPVVLITGNATETLRRRARLAGVRHVVEKPLLDGTLIDSIAEVLRSAL